MTLPASSSGVAKRERGRRHDRRRRVSQPWRALYDTARWQRLRLEQLKREPLCERCRAKGRTVPASVVHHLQRHNGNPSLFFGSPLESLCKPCHDADVQAEERNGFSHEIGADGWPIDANHPANAAPGAEALEASQAHVEAERQRMAHPAWFRASKVPLVIVCGPPASGKSTYVREHASPTIA